MQHKLSILIITKNEEKFIKSLLTSLDFADEIVVVDSGSTDKTTEIAKELGAKVLFREFDYHSAQKNWGLQQLKNDWVLILDADEKVSDELKQEIKSILNKRDIEEKAFWIRRKNFFMGEEVKYSGWQNDKVIRLLHKGFCKYDDKLVHEEIETNEKVGVLNNKLLHYTYKDFKTYFKKFQKYSTQKALIKNEKHEKVGFFHLAIKPGIKFFKHYVLHKGFLDGKVGLIISIMESFQDFLVYLKVWRIKNGEDISKLD